MCFRAVPALLPGVGKPGFVPQGQVQPHVPGRIGPGPDRGLQSGPDLPLQRGHSPILLLCKLRGPGIGAVHDFISIACTHLGAVGLLIFSDYFLFKTFEFFQI